MNPRALLLNPWITDFAAFDHWTRPLNLLRLGSLLRSLGWQIDFYDCLDRLSPDMRFVAEPARHRLNRYGSGHYHQEIIPKPSVIDFVPRRYRRYGVPMERVEQRLRELPPPDLIVIPCMMTYWYPGAFEAIRMAKRLFPQAFVVLGGIYATLCQEHAQAQSGADAVLVGPHWFDIVNQMHRALGLAEPYRSGDQSTWIEPAYDLLHPDETCFPVLTSTGCPCHCTYCATHSLWPHYKPYDVTVVADSLHRLARDFQAADIAFYDDALLSKRDTFFIPLMEEILRRGIHLRYHTPNALHVRQINREVAFLLKRAGFTTIRLGLEVVQKEWQKTTGGKVYTHEYQQATRYLREAGFTPNEVGTYIIVGMPGQPLSLVEEACEIVWKCGSEVKLTQYSPLPHTEMFAHKDGSFHFDPRQDPLLQNNSIMPWRSSSIPPQAYQALRQKVVRRNENGRKFASFSPSE